MEVHKLKKNKSGLTDIVESTIVAATIEIGDEHYIITLNEPNWRVKAKIEKDEPVTEEIKKEAMRKFQKVQNNYDKWIRENAPIMIGDVIKVDTNIFYQGV